MTEEEYKLRYGRVWKKLNPGIGPIALSVQEEWAWNDSRNPDNPEREARFDYNHENGKNRNK